MRAIQIICVLFLVTGFTCNSYALNVWTWIDGSNTVNFEEATYNELGVPEEDATPGVRSESISWSDNDGRLWLLGGSKGFMKGRGNDVWTYEPTIGQWACMRLFGTSPIYGQEGIPCISCSPGVRSGIAASSDNEGNLWIYGGQGPYFTVYNDLWKFDIETLQWIWINGSNISGREPIYGTQNVANPNNTPGARNDAHLWVDSEGYVWLFGGYNTSSELRPFNDLWRFNPDTGQWTWFAGSSTHSATGIYVNSETEQSIVEPGSRSNALVWCDSSNYLYLFGGYGYGISASGQGLLNDLWRYNLREYHWDWLGGSPWVEKNGDYNSPNPWPGARSHAIGWADTHDNLWLFGGYGRDESAYGKGNLQDHWKYDIQSADWTWVKGSPKINQYGIYGSPGSADETNIPGSRSYSQAWFSPSNHLYLYGGDGYSSTRSGGLSDLWRYSPKRPVTAVKGWELYD